MKKLIIFVLVGILLFSTTACNNNTINAPEEQLQNRQQLQEEQQTEKEQIYEIIKENLIIGEGTEWELPGILTLPKDYDGKIPAVVLVHGSGMQDMDSTIHANKPFRDIAEYLASQGIAVIRYDKRTFVYTQKFIDNFMDLSARNMTVHEETVEDAVLAANILQIDERIDSEKIFMIGLSMGGMLAPRIDAEGGNFTGLIIMAGSPRTQFPEIWYDQAINELTDITNEIEKTAAESQIYEILGYFNSLNDMTPEEARELSFWSVTGYYIKEMNEYPSNEYLKNLGKPILIMHGDKDIQVFTDRDFEGYKDLLQGKDNITFKLYPDLNHLFMTSVLGTVAEYAISDTVNAQVLQDIVDWINEN